MFPLMALWRFMNWCSDRGVGARGRAWTPEQPSAISILYILLFSNFFFVHFFMHRWIKIFEAGLKYKPF